VQGAGFLTLALLLLVPSSLAQPLRVTSWNLQPPTVRTNAAGAITNGISIPAAANALKKLNPDVILLQQVNDWTMCEQLAQALWPAKYNVVACSAFREPRTSTLRKQQVAILAKARARAVFSWSEPWRNRGVTPLPGGFTFAALQIGQQRVGFFSAQTAAQPSGPAAKQPGAAAKQPRPGGKQQNAATQEERLSAAIEQLLLQVDSARNWGTNRVQAIVVGGTFATVPGREAALANTPLQLLQEAGFGDVFQDTPAAERPTMRVGARQTGMLADYIFTQPANCAINPSIMRLGVTRRFPVTCDVQLDTPVVVAERKPRLQPPTAEHELPKLPDSLPAVAEQASAPARLPADRVVSNTPEPERSRTSFPPPQMLWIAAALGSLMALVAVVWALIWRGRARSVPSPALLTNDVEAPSGYTVVMASQSAAESTAGKGHTPPPPSPLIRMEAAGTTQTQTEALRQQALAAEQRADRALAVIRAGLIPQLGQWLKQTFTRKLIRDRAQLLQTQQVVALKAMAVEQRLTRIEQQIQQQNRAYEERIEELTRELLVAREENRELIRARIVQVRADMEAARARLMAQSNSDVVS